MSKIVSGAKWTTLSALTIAASQILRLSILTRFLDKSDFGIVAIITFILGLTQVFGDLGFTVAVMHKKKVTQNEFSSVFWSQMLIFILIYCALVIFTPFIAHFYQQEIIKTLMPIALIDIIFWGVGKLYDTILQKQMKFKVIAIRSIISSILSLFLAWVLAYYNFGIYSLILSTLFYSGFNNFWNFILGQNEYRLRLHMAYSEVKPFLSIGLYKTGTQILDYISAKLDILIIGKFLGTDILGLYNLSKELVLKVTALTNIIVGKVALPYFVSIQENTKLLQVRYCDMVRLLATINMPIYSALFIFSSLIVTVLYGNDYIYVSKLITLLSIYTLINSISSSEGILVAALGKTHLDFKWTIIRVFLTITLILIAAQYSIEKIIFAQILISIIGFLYIWKYIINKLILLKLYTYFQSFAGILLISITVCLLLKPIVNADIFNIDNIYLQIFLYGMLFCVLFLSAIFLVYQKQVNVICKTLIRK